MVDKRHEARNTKLEKALREAQQVSCNASECKQKSAIESLQHSLAEAQAREAKLHVAMCLATASYNQAKHVSEVMQPIREALMEYKYPTDHSALDAVIKDAVEEEREAIIALISPPTPKEVAATIRARSKP